VLACRVTPGDRLEPHEADFYVGLEQTQGGIHRVDIQDELLNLALRNFQLVCDFLPVPERAIDDVLVFHAPC